jgi:hypothetical protein
VIPSASLINSLVTHFAGLTSRMRKTLAFLIFVTVMLALIGLGKVLAACGGDCDSTYQSDSASCHLMYGSDPDDADDLSMCIQNARDDYRTCTESCADQAD